MNVFQKVTYSTMKQNKVRTLVTIIGVILSAAMFTAVTTFCLSLFDFLEDTTIYHSGSYHLYDENISGEAMSKISSDSRTDKAAKAEILGYALLEQSINDYKPYLYVEAGDSNFFEVMPVHLTSGKLPKNDSEIILPDHLYENGGVKFNLNDTLKIDLGDRMADNEVLTQYTSFNPEAGEELIFKEQKSYKVVGFYKRPNFEKYSAPGYTAITKSDKKINSASKYNAYILVNDINKDIESFVEDYDVDRNYDILRLYGKIEYDNFQGMITAMGAIFCLIIFAGSVSLIYSAFSISVSERTKQFGLLSSVGATKKQIRKAVNFEAFIISLIGIPIGIIVGISGIGITLKLCEDLFSSLSDTPFSITLNVSFLSLIIAAATAFFTVLVSAYIPSRRAVKVTAIDAIRQHNDIKGKVKNVRYSKLFYKLFGIEGVLGKKYYKRSRKKYRTTVISLAMSVILFISASGFCMYLTKTAETSTQFANYEAAFCGSLKDSDEIKNIRSQLAALDTVSGVTISLTERADFYHPVNIPKEDCSKEFTVYKKERHMQIQAPNDAHYYSDSVYTFYMDDGSFNELLEKNHLKREKYFDPENPKALVLNKGEGVIIISNKRKVYSFSYLKGGTESLEIKKDTPAPKGYYCYGSFWSGNKFGEGDIYDYYVPEDSDVVSVDSLGRPENALKIKTEFDKVPLGDFIEEAPLGVSDLSGLCLIYPISMKKDLEEHQTVNIYVKTDNPKEAIKNMKTVFDQNSIKYTNQSFVDKTEQDKLTRNMITILNVFSYGFIILISLIAIANVFNTISTNIALRRRDYAMLRSIGMTHRGMNRMMNYECILYGTRSLIIGLPISFAVVYIIYLSVGDVFEMAFTLPWTAVVTAVLCVFIVVFTTMMYAMNKIKKDNPIEALKNENI